VSETTNQYICPYLLKDDLSQKKITTMELRKLTKEKLYEEIGTYLDRVDTVEMYLEETNDAFMRNTYLTKLQEYRTILNSLILEKERRIEEGEITIISQQEYEEKHHDKEFFKDISVVFKTSHFQRIESGNIDQDYDIDFEIYVKTFNDRYAASFQLPVGFKEGFLLKREGNSVYYTGNGYDFEISFDHDKVTKIIIYQENTGASFIYT
jgi:hypothetical protein